MPDDRKLHDWEQYNLTDAERQYFRELRAAHLARLAEQKQETNKTSEPGE